MKRTLLFFCFSFILLSSQAQTRKIISVQNALLQLSNAMISGDKIALEKIASNHLSYGHSGGHVEDKAAFVEKISSGKSDFVSIDISEQTIDIIGKIAIVRHLFNGITSDSGKPGSVKLKVLLILKKEGRDWKILARQAVKA